MVIGVWGTYFQKWPFVLSVINKYKLLLLVVEILLKGVETISTVLKEICLPSRGGCMYCNSLFASPYRTLTPPRSLPSSAGMFTVRSVGYGLW